MNELLKTQMRAGLVALSCCAAGSAAAADESLPARAITALGLAIASQGDAALAQIRDEVKHTVVERIQPYLPQHTPANKQPAQDTVVDTTR